MSVSGLAALMLPAVLVAASAQPSVAPAPAKPCSVPASHGKPVKGLPGCSAALAASVRERLDRMTGPPSAAELQEIWRSPCLAHLARFFAPPEGIDATELEELWWGGLSEALRSSIGGLELRDGARVFVIPPEQRPKLKEETRAALDGWVCAEDEAACDRSLSYRLRAERAFDRATERGPRVRPPGAVTLEAECAKERGQEDETAFEVWASCLKGRGPRVGRYARVRLRAPERGWLVLRGRRGHYSFSDELRAYDLATGAAFVVRSSSDLVLKRGGHVDLGKTDAQRRIEAFTGTVARDQVRELAFVLATARAAREVRTQYFAPVPQGIELAFHPGDEPMTGVGGGFWVSSAQTQIGFSLVGATPSASGSFTWPNASDPVEDHADELVRVLEAGLVRGCAPARPPQDLLSLASGRGAVSHLDADPEQQDVVEQALDRAFEALRASSCPDAR